MHPKSVNAVLLLHVFHGNCKLMVSINCSRNLSPTEGSTVAAQRVHIESESEYSLSQYKFTREFALRCTAGNRIILPTKRPRKRLSNKDTQKSWRMCLTLVETKIRHVQRETMASVSDPSETKIRHALNTALRNGPCAHTQKGRVRLLRFNFLYTTVD